MARGVNWSRIASRNRMRRQGVEDRTAIEPAKKPRRKLSKAELREQAAAASPPIFAPQRSRQFWPISVLLISVFAARPAK
jgi:hypothetical protein